MIIKSSFPISLFTLAALLAPSGLPAQSPAGDHPAANARPVGSRVPRLVKYAGQTSKSVRPRVITPDTETPPPAHAAAPVRAIASVTFALYAEQEGGAALWQETQNVALDADGRYTVLLGAASRDGMPAELFATGESRWLSVRINVPGDAEASAEQARVLLVSVPYALRAADAETLGGRAATEFVLREELAGWSGVAAGVTPGAPDRPRAVGGSQGVVFATGAVNFMPRVTSIDTPSVGDVTYANSQIFDDGTNIRIGNPAVGTGLVNIELTTPLARSAFSSVLRLENVAPITGTVISALTLTGADRATSNHESFQVARFTLLKNVISTGVATNFDAIFATTSFINQNAPYTIVGWRAEYPRVAPGMTLGTYFGLFLEAPLGGGGTITNAFALVTAPGSGNVGIGTTAPAHLLDVAGNARVTGDLRAGQYLDLAGNPIGGGGGGTVTSVGAGNGLSTGVGANPITGAGTLEVDFTGSTGAANTVARSDHNHNATYLQLTGGTLTGALNGTSGTFTSTVSGPTGSFSSRLIARGTLEAAALGTATSGTGFNSASQVFFYSVHNGTTNLTQDFRWIATPQGNGAANPTGQLKLQWGNGISLAADTGLSIADTGIITFAAGQTFPGGGGSVTQVNSGAGLQGGPITSTGTLSLINCASGEILKASAPGSWGCNTDLTNAGGGDLTDVLQGAGISVTNGGGPQPTVAIDTAVVPQLGSSNTFAANNIFSASSASPIVEVTQNGTGYAIAAVYNGSSPFFAALRANATNSTSNRVHGVEGLTQSTEAGAAGVRGVASNGSSAGGIGVFGFANGPAGNGVQGVAGAASGSTVAVAGFATASPGGIGVSGEGGFMGVSGRSLSPTGPGGRFQNSSTGPILQGLNSASAVVFSVAGSGATSATGFFHTGGRIAGLLPTCTAGQIMKVNGGGTDWQCDTDLGGAGGVSITQGTGIIATPNPITGSGSVAIDTTVVPRLNIANSFNQLNSFLGGLNVTSVSASSANISANSANPLLQIDQTGSTRALDVSYSGTANNSFAVQVSASANTTNVVTGIYASTNSSSGGAIGILGESVNAAGPGTGVAGSSTGAGGVGVQGFANANSGATTGVGGIATASTSGVGVRGTGGFLGVLGISSSATGAGGRFQNTGTGPLLQGLNSASSTVFSVAQNGAVTSSGSVTANGYFQSNGRIAGLLPTCTGSQIMKMNPGGTDWQCDSDQGGGGGSGDVTDVLAGTGILVATPAGPQPSVSIDTAVVPRLGASNTFTQPNTFNAAVAVGSANLTVDTNTLFVDATNNRVGIGTSSPAKELHIVGGANTGFTLESSASNGNPTLTVKANSPAGHAAVVIDRADTGAPAQLVFSTGGTSNWRLWSPVGVFDRLDFANAVNAPTMTFTQGGNIGIGTTSPGSLLTVAGAVTASSYVDTGGRIAGLLPSCTAGQIMKVNPGNTNWQCDSDLGGGGSGDLTDILAGTGISVLNGAGPSPAVSIDTTVVPRMNVVNTFTANQIFNTNLTVDTNTLFVDSVNNRLGVGTVTPTAKIQVVNDSITAVPFSARAVASQTAPMALFQDSGGQFLTSITVDGHLSTLGVLDVGDWTGTTEIPNVTEPATGTTNVFEGLVVRRINSAIVNVGTIVAATDSLQLERDGTSGGFVVRLISNARRQSVQCFAVQTAGTSSLVARNDIAAGSSLTTYQVFTNAENVLFIHCMLGNPENQGHHAEVSLHRAPTSIVWVGTVTSTFNQ